MGAMAPTTGTSILALFNIVLHMCTHTDWWIILHTDAQGSQRATMTDNNGGKMVSDRYMTISMKFCLLQRSISRADLHFLLPVLMGLIMKKREASDSTSLYGHVYWSRSVHDSSTSVRFLCWRLDMSCCWRYLDYFRYFLRCWSQLTLVRGHFLL